MTIEHLFSKKLFQQLRQAFGQTFSEAEIYNYFQNAEVIEPDAGQLLWESKTAPSGLYLIGEGKVRLSDVENNLIVSLEPGMTFGEQTLFPEAGFHPYQARASVGVKLFYFKGNDLQILANQYPGIKKYLHHRAVDRDLLLCHHFAAASNPKSIQHLLKLLPLLQSHHLPVGELPPLLSRNAKIWLIRRGELVHSSGQKLSPGNLYALPNFPEGGTWRVTRPTELYSLDRSQKEAALSQLSSQESSNSATTGLPARNLPVPDQFNPFEPDQPDSSRGTSKAAPKPAPKTALKTTASPQNPEPTHFQTYFPSPSIKISHWWQQASGRYPFHRQQSTADCGVACLVMIGQYWGKQFSFNHLRPLANVSREGTSLRGLVMAAEALGFAPRPVKAELKSFNRENLPAIAHWEGNHYVVVYQITRDRVLIADPAVGRRRLTHQAFLKGWTGYALLLQPTPLLNQVPEAESGLWKFGELLKPHWFILMQVLIASVAIQVFGVVTPMLTQILLDRVVVERSATTLAAIGTGLLIFSLFQVLTLSLRRYLIFHTANKIDIALIVGFVSHAFRLPLSYFESRYVGDITSRIEENRKIRRFLTGEALTLLLDLLTVFVYVGLMFWYSWSMALLALVVVPFFILLAVFATPFLKQISQEIFNVKTVEDSYLIEALTGIRTIKSMGTERTVRWRWEELFNKSVKVHFSGQLIHERITLASSLIETIVSRGLLVFGVWLVIHDQLSVGQLIAFNMLVGNVINPFKELIDLWNEFQEIVIAVERINDVIETPPEEDLQQLPAHLSLPPLTGSIRFDRVTFRYDLESDANTLENLNFEIKPGQTVAIVGRSGSGKTTIAKLLLALYPPTSGKIWIDGHDISTISLHSLRQQVGVVDQDTFLFGGTIRENLCIARPGATMAEIQEAAGLAGAKQFIEKLPLQYETRIGEGGGLLSGGQRQRLAIARALLGRPRLLILDEATSSLDTESERIIQTNLNTILKQQTTLVIAHRLSTIRNADLILVLDRGILVESGTHQELMARRGQYFYLNQQQMAIAS